MYKLKFFVFFLISIFFFSCQDEVLPKPKAYLRLAHNQSSYKTYTSDCPFQFEIPSQTKALINKKCWVKISYPKLKATLNLTYRPVKGNLRELMLESEKLTTKHAGKASKISYSPLFENYEDKVFGRVSDVVGNAASPLQFYVTDSVKHFITGSLYFNVQPNYDSIYPSVKHIEKDIKYLIETTRWRK